MSDQRQPDDGSCGLAPLYVLLLLDEVEQERFVEHAESCVVCRDEIAAFAPVVDTLGESVPLIKAPRKIRRNVMSAVRAEAKVTEALAGSQRRTGRARLKGGWRVPSMQPLAIAASLCALLVAGGAIGAAIFGSSSPRTVTTSAEVRVPNATAALHRSGSHLWLTVAHMPSPGKGRVYEVWLEHGSGVPSPTSALFSPTTNGAGEVAVPGDLKGVSEIMVTSEPEGGSLKPTRSPVIVGRVS
jgi:Anti-sigma-K factor rskA